MAAAGSSRTGWVELRVHGVSGTPPHDMLDLTQPSQADRVAGDDTTGFYVRRPDAPIAPGTESPAGVHLEAFSWGALTSGARGAWARALWLLLVPFALANVAYWSRPGLAAGPGPERRPTFRRDGAGAAAVRVGAVLLTGVFAASSAVVGLDVVALRCLGGAPATCAGIPGFVTFTAAGYWAGPGRLVALGLLVPLAAVATVWWLSRRTEARYEQTADPSQAEVRSAAAIMGGADLATPHLLQQPDLWQGDARVARLRNSHVAAALGVVVAFAGTTVLGSPGGAPAGWFGLVAGTLLVVSACVVVAVQRDDGPDGRSADGRARPLRWAGVPRPLSWASLAAVGVLVVLLLVTTIDPPTSDRPSRWIPLLLVVVVATTVAVLGTRAYDGLVGPAIAALAVVASTAAAAVLTARTGAGAWALLATAGLVVALPLHRRDDPVRRGWMWAGAAPGVFLGGGLFVGVLYSTAAVMGTAAFLGGGVDAVTATGSRFAPPPAYSWFAAGVLVALLLSGVLVGGWWLVTRRMRPGVAAMLGADTSPTVDGAARSDRLRARLLGARLRRGEDLLGLVAVASAAAGLVAVAGTLSTVAPGDHGVAGDVTAVGTALSVLAATGLVLLGRALGSGDGLRRGVGILWDLSGFWPRCAHPFAPPCYAERAVPDLYTRSSFHLAERRGLLLSGHSLGGVLAIAVLVRLPVEGQQRTALLTYGSQLRQYFGRGFPGVFGPDVLGNVPATRLAANRYEYPGGVAASAPPPAGSVAALLATRADAEPGQWRNLFRRTDPLGFPVYEDIAVVGQDAGARVDRVTTEVEVVPAGDPRPATVQTHGGYTRTEEYAQARAALLAALPT